VALLLSYGILAPNTSPVLREFARILIINAKPPGVMRGRLHALRSTNCGRAAWSQIVPAPKELTGA